MPRLILKCPYLKPGGRSAEHRENYTRYISTREGVDKIDDSRRHEPATENQKQLINQVLKDFPGTKDLFEYRDYLEKPTVGNASEFITQALDQNLDRAAKRENYVDYIAKRPRAERVGDHGLFTDDGVPVTLSQVAREVAEHPGNVWLPIISLRREDAQRLGYDSGQAWRELLRSQTDEIARCFKIKRENFRWYASFHDESHHPHVHMICYSTNPYEGFLTVQGIEAMKSGLAKQIFRQDLLEIYAEQTERRDTLTQGSEKIMRELCTQVASGNTANEHTAGLILQLKKRLDNTGGKKVYGYLKPDVKRLVDEIVDELARDERIGKMYDLWYEKRFDVLRTYTDQLPEKVPLSQQKEFKPIRNMVIREALELLPDTQTPVEAIPLPDNYDSPPPPEEPPPEMEWEPPPPPDYYEIPPEPQELPSNYDWIPPPDVYDAPPLPEEAPPEMEWEPPPDTLAEEPQIERRSGKPHIRWSDDYKAAHDALFVKDGYDPDFDRAFSLFLSEAQKGNALAMHDLGRMFADGLGREIDNEQAWGWYAKALDAFKAVEATDDKHKTYAQYRIGKMFAAGLGTDQDYSEAASWFGKAAAQNHKYAQYSLGCLYLRGQGVDKDFSEALRLFILSADQENAYASYECAKLYRDGLGTEKNVPESERRFREAFIGFQKMEAESSDDKLQYRLGQMLRDGVGTEKDVPAAMEYFEKSAKLGNVHAMYALAKLYLDSGERENIEKAIRWLTRSADGGNDLAQYSLGKIYLQGEHLEKDVAKAVELLTASADQGNQFAQYALGKLYLAEEDVPKDIAKAVELLAASADQGNQFAQYALGKLYLKGEDLPKDVAKAVELLTASADQGNEFAQYMLGKLYFMGQDVEQDKEKAIRYFTLSAEQGNEYAAFFLKHIPIWEREAVLNAAARLAKNLARMMEEDYRNRFAPRQHTDRKLLQKLARKKEALGIKISY